jgi:hypothetical protein
MKNDGQLPSAQFDSDASRIDGAEHDVSSMKAMKSFSVVIGSLYIRDVAHYKQQYSPNPFFRLVGYMIGHRSIWEMTLGCWAVSL